MNINLEHKWIWIGSIIGAFIIGWWLSGNGVPEETTSISPQSETSTIWTCSMHPQVRQPGPGQCPICGMDLIPLTSGSGSSQRTNTVELSPYAMKLAEIQVAPVEKKFVETEIRLVGKIDYDETKLGYITAWVPGRIERMYVDYSGISVRAGEHMVEIYSPELVATQQELIQTRRSASASSSEILENNLRAIKERLRLWGLTSSQIEKIAQSGKIQEKVTIYAPASGIVVEKNGLEGMYVETGTKIYTIADLSKVWVHLEAYERDIPWIRYGQKVIFETEAYPGESFTGRIAFIDPVLDEPTRTVMVRVNVSNTDLKLKPGMLVRAIVRSQIAAGGKVMDPDLGGKWICPMHPEIIKGGRGACDVCGMPLVRIEELGYISAENVQKDASLIIPATAPLITGKRAIVYVQAPDRPGLFEGREIELGPRAGDYYIVKSGLNEGELVVVNGNFKIDSAVQIQAGSSMMSPHDSHQKKNPDNMSMASDKVKPEPHNIPQEFKRALDPVYDAYFELQTGLSHDQKDAAAEAAERMAKAAESVNMTNLSGPLHKLWMSVDKTIQTKTASIQNYKDIEQIRAAFRDLSVAMIELARHAGSSGKQPVLVYHCPMAFDNQGADWLQNKSGTENPYFGSKMFTCGSQEDDLTLGANQHE